MLPPYRRQQPGMSKAASRMQSDARRIGTVANDGNDEAKATGLEAFDQLR